MSVEDRKAQEPIDRLASVVNGYLPNLPESINSHKHIKLFREKYAEGSSLPPKVQQRDG